MINRNLGKTLIIANPTAHSGKGLAGAEFCNRFFDSYESIRTSYDMQLTKAAGDATKIAQEAGAYDTVIALGGDGVIHEVIQGLMEIDKAIRPCLGIIPMGSGNDYAKTLGMVANDPDASIHQLLSSDKRQVEVGWVQSDEQSCYFMETLSFGLDAAIAIDTTNRRAKGTSTEGEQLFISSGMKIFSSSKGKWRCKAIFDKNEEVDITTTVFAINVGATYGGGFKIVPDADPSDGYLDVCYSQKTPNVPTTLSLFLLARFGRHTKSNILAFRQTKDVTIQFIGDPAPCQADGEEIIGQNFKVSVIPDALEVLCSPNISW